MTLFRFLVVLSLLLVVSSDLVAKGKKKLTPNFEQIFAGQSVSGVIDTTETAEHWVTYYFELPENTPAFHLWLTDAQGDLDICAQEGSPINDYTETEWCSELDDWNEGLLAHAIYADSFESGIWYVDVAYQLDDFSRDEHGLILDELSFELHLEFLTFQTEAELEPNKPVHLSLTPEWHAISWLELDIPRNVDAFRVDVFDTNGDIDLLLTQDPLGKYGHAIVVSDSLAGSESLIYEPDGGVEKGTYYLVVLDPFAVLEPVTLSLVLSYSTDAPDFLKEPIAPVIDQVGPHGAPIGATVQIISNSSWGSGNIVSADGWILTNDHVVRGLDGELLDSVIVAVVGDTSYPPKETFKARVVDGLKHPDLALLKIEEGLYGQPIPQGYQFPYWKWGNSSDLNLGDDVFVVGFPSVGGSGSRPNFTFTRGHLAGKEQSSMGSALITDALIAGGSSGGGLTAGNGELLALPSFTIDDVTIQMSYALSLDQVPNEWKLMIGID